MNHFNDISLPMMQQSHGQQPHQSPSLQLNENQLFLMQQFERMEQRNLAVQHTTGTSNDHSPRQPKSKLQQQPASISRGSSGAGPFAQTKLPPVAPVVSLNNGESRELPHMLEPGKFDVICARGSAAVNHVGNVRFRELIRAQLPRYNACRSKMEKSLIVSNIVDSVRDYSPNGGFVKKDKTTGVWYDVGDNLAREKIGQTIRDQLHSKYKSSTKAKKERRKAQTANDECTPTAAAGGKKAVMKEEPVPEVVSSITSVARKARAPKPLTLEEVANKTFTSRPQRRASTRRKLPVNSCPPVRPDVVESNEDFQREDLPLGNITPHSDLLNMMLLPLEEDLAAEGEELWDRSAVSCLY